MSDLLAVGGVIMLLLAGGLSIPHWLKRWRMDQAFAELQRLLRNGEVTKSWFGWPSFSGTFQGRPCQITFHTTLVSSSHGALGDLAARYRLGLSVPRECSISFVRPSAFSKWFGTLRRADSGSGLASASDFWNVVGPDHAKAELARRPELGKALQALRVCKIVTLDREWVEALEVEVSRRELRAERMMSMLTLLGNLAEIAESAEAAR